MRWKVRVACSPSSRSAPLGCIGDHHVAAVEGALAREPQLAPPAEDRASAAEGDGHDHELILVHEARFTELRGDRAAAEHGDAGPIASLQRANGVDEAALEKMRVAPCWLDCLR